jgi:hypothetical protein
MNKEGLAPPAAARSWTSIEAYLRPMRRRRRGLAARRNSRGAPHPLLTTAPYLALLPGFMVLAIANAVSAWPPSQPKLVVPQTSAAHEIGTAPKGWFERAKRDFHR